MWLGPPTAQKSWNSISSLFCMFISYFLHSLFAFPQFIFQKEKRQKKKEKRMFPFLSLSGMNFVFSLSITY